MKQTLTAALIPTATSMEDYGAFAGLRSNHHCSDTVFSTKVNSRTPSPTCSLSQQPHVNINFSKLSKVIIHIVRVTS